jgi:hypothetical protein
MNEILERYEELYEDMATSGNKDKMIAFGEAERNIFHKIAKEHPAIAQMWLDKLEAMHWKNYLSKQEAEEIASHLINQNGRIGAHWGYETFKAAVESLGGKMYEKPYYNCYALWATANMLYSDHYESAKKYVPESEMPKYFYSMALEKLKDFDKPKFVRWYFGL